MNKLFTIIALGLTSVIFAQQSSNLVIFSEDGLPFYLILNGVRQNAKPETNIKVDGLTQPYYSTKIIFEDKTQPVLERKVLQIQGAASTGPMEVTYKIKKNNKNVNVLRFFSETPLAQIMEQPNVTVVHYNTVPMPEITQVVITEQTTTTSTNTNDNININMSLGLPPSMNMNVNINDPNVVHQSTSTTVITTSSSHQNNGYNNNYEQQNNSEPKGCRGARPMNSSNFSAAKQTISNQKFDDTKLSTANQIINSNCLSSAQIKEIMLLFTFEDTRLKLAKESHGKCTDPNNYFLLNDAFKFDSSVEELNNAVK